MVIVGSLGNDGIICTEDLVHEVYLYTVGKCFEESNNFCWFFKLSSL